MANPDWYQTPGVRQNYRQLPPFQWTQAEKLYHNNLAYATPGAKWMEVRDGQPMLIDNTPGAQPTPLEQAAQQTPGIATLAPPQEDAPFLEPGGQIPDLFKRAMGGLNQPNPNEGKPLLPPGSPLPYQIGPDTPLQASGQQPQPGAPQVPAGNLYQTVNAQGPLDPNVPTPDLYNQILQKIMQTMNVEGRGLSPEAKAAMTTRALEQVPAEFARLKSDMATRMLREGGALPKGGAFNRESGQLLSSELATKFGLLRDVTIADEAEIARTREADRAFGLQALGLAGQLTGQRGQYELGQGELGQRWELAQLDANTRTQLAQMGITSQEKLAALDSDLRRELTQMGIDSNLVLGKLDAQTRLDLTKMQIAGDKTGLRIAASVASSVLNNPALMKEVVGGVKDIFGGGAGAGGAVGGLGASKFGSSILKFAKDPITIGVAAALAVGATWLKSQAHWEANSMVKEFENPFANDFVIPFHDNFFKAAEAGKMTKEDAGLAIKELETAWADYKAKVREWSKGSSDKELVANQSISGRSKSQGFTGQPNPGTLADTILRTLENMKQVEGAL